MMMAMTQSLSLQYLLPSLCQLLENPQIDMLFVHVFLCTAFGGITIDLMAAYCVCFPLIVIFVCCHRVAYRYYKPWDGSECVFWPHCKAYLSTSMSLYILCYSQTNINSDIPVEFTCNVYIIHISHISCIL